MQQAATSQQGLVVWFTGLSAAGKTTLCRALEPELRAMGYAVHVLDGEDIRLHLSRDLGFSKADRDKNVLRLGSLARTLARQSAIVLVAAISPYREARSRVKEQIGNFLEVYVNAPLEACIERDPKRRYARALTGEIRNFTGIDDPYEAPLEPDVQCNTGHETCNESKAKVMAAIRETLQQNSAILSEA